LRFCGLLQPAKTQQFNLDSTEGVREGENA